jgi:Tol biopolymer transport system component
VGLERQWAYLEPFTIDERPVRFLSPVAARAGSRIFFMGLDQPLGMQEFNKKEGFHPAPAFLADATRVDFSRDGAWVAWTDHDEKLWRARVNDGSDKIQLTPGYMEVFMAHWSPDSKRLAVMAREPGKVWRTYLVYADGGTPEPLLNEDRNAADPGWSADGQDLIFGREPDLMGKESGLHSIQIVHLATMKTETLPDSEGMFSPRWSPDGRWIIALSLNQKSLMLYDVVRERWKELARTSAADPIWSADSKSIYLHAFLKISSPF